MVKNVQIGMVNADRLILEHQALIDNAVKDRDGVSVDVTLLGRKDDIIALRDERSRIKDHPLGLAKREAESQALSENIKTLVLDLEWDITDEDSLDSALPSAIARKDIETLATTHGRLDEAATSTAENVRGKERDLADSADDLKTLPDLQLPPDIKSSLAEARTLGNTEDARVEFENRIKLASDHLENQLAKMRPWTGSVRDLPDLEAIRTEQTDRR